MFTVTSTAWTVVDAVDGTAAFPEGVAGVVSGRDLGDGVSQHTALAAAAAAVALDPTVAATLTVMPVSALLDSEPTPL